MQAATQAVEQVQPSIADQIAQYVGRLNLSTPASAAGGYFTEIVALTCLITGGFLIFFGWKHHRFVLGLVGMLVGGGTGLVIKKSFAPMGAVPALPYLVVCGAIGAMLAITLRRFVGILLGGFTAACVAVVVFPAYFRAGQETYLALSVAFLFGGGFGALYPRFFFIFNTSLTGASFATYGLGTFIARAEAAPAGRVGWILLQLGVFLPLLIAGIVYQYRTAPPADESSDLKPLGRKGKAKAGDKAKDAKGGEGEGEKPKAKGKSKPEPEPAGARA